MKSFLWFLLVIVVIVILFLLVGLLSPGQKSTDEIVIQAPTEYVWSQYLDKSLMPDWMPGLKSISLVNGQEGEAGAEYVINLSSINEGESIMNQTVTEIIEYDTYGFDFDSDHLIGNTLMQFSAQGDTATVVKAINEYTGKETWTTALLQIFRQGIDKNSMAQYNSLKEMIESNYLNTLSNNELIKSDTIEVVK